MLYLHSDFVSKKFMCYKYVHESFFALVAVSIVLFCFVILKMMDFNVFFSIMLPFF